ncbi:MAG TPA: hypothetical protein VF618_08670 [Thermoanaerobaculia bacterium]
MKSKLVVLVYVLLHCVAAAAQESAAVRSYAVPGHGALKLSVPAGWTDGVRGQEGLPPTIRISYGEGDGDVLVMITPFWSPKGDAQFNSTENIRTAVERSREAVLPSAVEKELVLRPIRTASGEGHFFWATDRAPKAGEYEYVASGAVPAGKLLVTFTILSHAEPPAGIDKALAILKSAIHEP